VAGSAAPRRPLILASSRSEPDALAQIQAGTRPRLDYLSLAEALGGEVLDTRAGESLPAWQRRVERALSSDVGQARTAWRRRGLYGAWLSTSERVGLPLALLAGGRRESPPHVLIAHNLASANKRRLHRLMGVLRWGFSAIICLSRVQQAFLLEEVGLPPDRVYHIPHNVDTRFFRPGLGCEGEGDYVLAVGREGRDYATLIEVARLVGQPLTIVASSLWALRGGVVEDAGLPPNVTVRREFLSYTALRALYAGARLVVVPLHECPYAAGSTGLLEAMAMGRPVVVTRTQGLEDYLADSNTHRAVPPADAPALADAIRALWNDAAARAAMARAARAAVEAEMDVERYVAHVAAVVRRAMEE